MVFASSENVCWVLPLYDVLMFGAVAVPRPRLPVDIQWGKFFVFLVFSCMMVENLSFCFLFFGL